MRQGIAHSHEKRRAIRSGLFLLLLIGVITIHAVGVVSSTDEQDARSVFAVKSIVSSLKPSSLPDPFRLTPILSVSRAPGTPKPLTNGVTMTGTLNASGESELWYIDISDGARSMRSVLTPPDGSGFSPFFELYGRRNVYPTTSSYDWSTESSVDTKIEISSPASGRWYILVHSFLGKGTYLLTITVLYNRTAKPLPIGVPVTGSLNATADSDLWHINVYREFLSMEFTLECPSGADFDLYVKWGSYPTTSNYTLALYNGGDEHGTLDRFESGELYVMPYSYRGNGTYQLTVTMEYPSPVGFVVSMIIFIAICTIFIPALMIIGGRRSVKEERFGLIRDYQIGLDTQTTESGIEHGTDHQRASSVRLAQCSSCGASVELRDTHCWNCGALATASLGSSFERTKTARERVRPGVCMVCKVGLEKGDEMLFCPFCGSLAHRNHLLEWLHVKDYCPSCGRHLDEDEVNKQMED